MKRFEAIEIEIEELANFQFTEHNIQLLSELKQIRDEHSEMVWMLNRIFLDKANGTNNINYGEIKQLLSKINNK